MSKNLIESFCDTDYDHCQFDSHYVLNGDSLNILSDLPSSTVDIVLTDPPYNISKDGTSIKNIRKKKGSKECRKDVNMNFGEWDIFAERKDFIEFTQAWYTECVRILKDGGVFISFFGQQDYSILPWTGNTMGMKHFCKAIWRKTNPMPHFRKTNFSNAYEEIYIGVKGDKPNSFNFTTQKDMQNVYSSPNKSTYGQTKHPTEKSIELIQWLLNKFITEENTIILDPFAGSGTTAVTGNIFKATTLSIEKEKEYYEIIKTRLEKETSQMKLF